MKELNAELVKSGFRFPKDVSVSQYRELPVKVLQFGEGNFLRGFVDWMIDRMNSQGLFNGSVTVVQPIAQGLVEMLNRQDGLYTLYLRGIQEGKVVEEKSVISSIRKGINPYTAFEEYLQCAENPELRFVISNTTEAGIAYSPDDKPDDRPPASFPGKLTVFLYKRFKAFHGDPSKGLVMVPCELIDRNGDQLKRIVLQLAKEWKLEPEFVRWLENANHFLNTLVDRIVTGYPKDEVERLTQELGYSDPLVNTAEIFHLWVIEGSKELEKEFPLVQAGLQVIWTDDMTPYRTRKVRILNGAHTMTVLAAYLYGKDTVKECMDDSVISAFMRKGIYEEIIPTLDLPQSELAEFAAAVSERFANPFIRHYLLSISLNSTSKFKTRVLPSILEYYSRKEHLPMVLTFSMAAYIAFYKGTEIRGTALVGNRAGSEYNICDDMDVLELFSSLWKSFDGSEAGVKKLVWEVLSQTRYWGMDLNLLPEFTDRVSGYLFHILNDGMEQAIREVL